MPSLISHLDGGFTGLQTSATSWTTVISIPAGSGKVLFVGVCVRNSDTNIITKVTCGGNDLTQIVAQRANNVSAVVDVWYKVNPPTDASATLYAELATADDGWFCWDVISGSGPGCIIDFKSDGGREHKTTDQAAQIIDTDYDVSLQYLAYAGTWSTPSFDVTSFGSVLVERVNSTNFAFAMKQHGGGVTPDPDGPPPHIYGGFDAGTKTTNRGYITIGVEAQDPLGGMGIVWMMSTSGWGEKVRDIYNRTREKLPDLGTFRREESGLYVPRDGPLARGSPQLVAELFG